MAKTLVLELADNTDENLLQRSDQIGQTPEQIILEWIEHHLNQTRQDPLLQLAGIFEAETSDISTRHDEYIGETLSSNHD